MSADELVSRVQQQKKPSDIGPQTYEELVTWVEGFKQDLPFEVLVAVKRQLNLAHVVLKHGKTVDRYRELGYRTGDIVGVHMHRANGGNGGAGRLWVEVGFHGLHPSRTCTGTTRAIVPAREVDCQGRCANPVTV